MWSKGLTMYYADATSEIKLANGVFFLALVLMLIRKFSRGFFRETSRLPAKFRENKALANQSVDY